MDYKSEVMKLLSGINNERYLKMIYGFIKGLLG